jgi:hypothetical protein
MRRLPFTLLLLAFACSPYRPARFANLPPAREVADDTPIPMPHKRQLISELHDADVYVRRELVGLLDPRRQDEGHDVTATDEVPGSSWFKVPALFDTPLKGYRRDGAPVPPFTALKDAPVSDTPGARVIVDARGLRYELLADPKDRAGMATGAAAIASRLVFALGYLTPEVHVITTPEGERVAATRWPIGVDLGPTPIERRRDDDPNDLIDHRDRRTLRALKLVAAWLDLKRMPPRMLRDAYVGAAGLGHVQHFIVGLDGALGVDRYEDALAWSLDKDREDPNFFLRLFSLGLSPKPAAFPPETRWPSVGLLEEFVPVADYAPSPPFEPIDRLQPADAYWIAKRIAALPQRILGRAVLSSKLPQAEQNWLLQMLHLRRAQVVAWGYDRTTPLEPNEVLDEDPSQKLWPRLSLTDLAILSGMTKPERSKYQVRFLDARGARIAQDDVLRPAGARLIVPLPSSLRNHQYLVLRITAIRGQVALPRAMEVHLRPSKAGFTLAGVRH